ncbi:hypothetical protein K8R61_00840 [bacterium]|nr:hypothetical protein [bacterium]
MKLRNTKILFSALLFLIWAGVCHAGLGISPSRWIEENALRGAHMEKIFTISQAKPEQDLFFKATVEGEIKDWIKIDQGLEFIAPKGEQQFPIKVIIDVPQGADFKEYQGKIRLRSEQKLENGNSGVGVILSSLILINLTVSQKEVLDYEILQIAIPEQEENKFLNVVLKIWNKGNVEVKPTKLTIDFWDEYRIEKIDTKEVTDFSKINPVSAFSKDEIKIEIPINFEANRYWAIAKVYQNDELIKEEDITFKIIKKEILKTEGENKEISKNETLDETFNPKYEKEIPDLESKSKDKMYFYMFAGIIFAILLLTIGLITLAIYCFKNFKRE